MIQLSLDRKWTFTFSVACNPTDPVLLFIKKKKKESKDESLTADVSWGVSSTLINLVN